jgi:ketosteroid isomerase-like protein
MLSAADRLDILDVVTRADDAATRRDVKAYVAFFTDDSVLDGDKGEHRGKEQLQESVGPIWASEGPTSTHCTLNAIVNGVEGDPDRAVVTSQLMILGNESPVSVASLSFITQDLVRMDHRWLIERRSVRSRPA